MQDIMINANTKERENPHEFYNFDFFFERALNDYVVSNQKHIKVVLNQRKDAEAQKAKNPNFVKYLLI